MHKDRYDVVIAGGGPTGLMLAAELALAGVDAVVIERRADQDLMGARSGGLHARTIEILDQRGIAERFIAAGTKAQVAGFAGVPLDISDFPTRHNYGLALWQREFERILADWVGTLPVHLLHGVAVTGADQAPDGVAVMLDNGQSLRGRYLVGCDGGRSLVRKLAGIDFTGSDPTTSNLIAEAELTQEPEWGIHRDAAGIHALRRMEDGRTVGIMMTEAGLGDGSAPREQDLRAAMIATFGTDYGLHNVTWLSRFTDATRQAASYRRGRILLAGDAAHTHPPDGGQGLQTGVQDAVNLGWKLALVAKGLAPQGLLDTYQAERHPVAAAVLLNTMASVALRREDSRTGALRQVMGELLGLEDARKHYAGIMSGLSIHYDLGPGHPLLGRRMPDLDLDTADGTRRVTSFLHRARPVLFNFGAAGTLDITGWADRVTLVEAGYDGDWLLPVIGQVSPPQAVLVRPDGHAAWVGDGTDTGLVEALEIWFGPRRAQTGSASPSSG